MVAADKVCPTAHQIESNVIVVPRPFRDTYCLDVDWEDFTLDAFGVITEHRSLDFDRRIGLPLRGRIVAGDVLVLSIENDTVVVRRDETPDP